MHATLGLIGRVDGPHEGAPAGSLWSALVCVECEVEVRVRFRVEPALTFGEVEAVTVFRFGVPGTEVEEEDGVVGKVVFVATVVVHV